MTTPKTREQYLSGSSNGMALYRALANTIVEVGDAEVRVSKSQIAFRRRRGFAYVWRPGKYVSTSVPAVLSIALGMEVTSSRFKEVVHPSANVWMHHIELREFSDIDSDVHSWLAEAWGAAR